MDAQQINDFYTSGAWKTSSRVPMLTTGTQPANLGSAVSVPLPDNAVVATNAVPTPNGIPWGNTTQNQKYRSAGGQAPPAPWVSVPACSAFKPIPTPPPIGLSGPRSAVNLKVNTYLPRRLSNVQGFTT